ncbi:MAG: molybdopterin-dependent oxidoreductase [Microbacteriaceae bacterium]
MVTTHTSFCRYCGTSCPVLVDVDDGALTNVRGDPANPIYAGYTCVKGRAAPEMHNHPDRLLRSLKRLPSGEFTPIAVQTAMDEIAERLTVIHDRHGPRAIASYFGTSIMGSPLTEPFLAAFMRSLGSRMCFTPNTIDKPGKQLAAALHGRWMAPMQGYDEPDVALLLGANPFKSYYGVACGNPSTWLGERMRAGMQLIVVDPRRSDVAKRASLHIQPVPGEDTAILACLIHVILDEGLYDRDFVDAHAVGVDELGVAVRPFTPEAVARRADVSADDLRTAARVFATARRGYAACGVGPGFSSSTTLVEYLTLNLETLCGHWLRAGEPVKRSPTLLPPQRYVAQALPPRPAHGYGERFRVHGLTETPAGMPTGILADEILLEGDGQIRALLSVAGNPVSAWPDQLKVITAMETLDLLVQIDPWMSSTSRYADYVIAPRMPYEVPSATMLIDLIISLPTFYGPAESYAQYTPAIVEPPAGSDVITEWEFFFGLARRMGRPLAIRTMRVTDDGSPDRIELDMEGTPTADDLIERLTAGSRVALDEVRRHPHGAAFPDPMPVVAEAEPGWSGRLDLANGEMMADLAAVASSAPSVNRDYPMRLICQRVQHAMNSSLRDQSTHRGRGFNPAWMHPDDLASLGLSPGDVVRIRSPRAQIIGIAGADHSLRRGLVAMAHGFGDAPDRDDEFRRIGSATGRLLDGSDFADRYVGMPRMSNIAVTVERWRE